MPAWSASNASFLLSGQLPDQRSGTSVTARPDEQLSPNKPICSLLPPCMAKRAFIEGEGACIEVSFETHYSIAQKPTRRCGSSCRLIASRSPSTHSSVILPPLVL